MSDGQSVPVNSTSVRRLTTVLFYALAACLVFVGFRVTFKKTDAKNGKVAMYLFAAAAAGVIFAREFIYLLPNLVKLKVAGVDIQLREEVRTLKEDLREIKLDLVEGPDAGSSAKSTEAEFTEGEG